MCNEVSQEPVPVALFDIYPSGKLNFSLKSRFKGERIPQGSAAISPGRQVRIVFLAWTDDDPDEPMKVQLSPDFDEAVHFASLLDQIHHGATLNLVDVAFDEENHAYRPEMVWCLNRII